MDQRESLDAPITAGEIKEAIRTLQSGKAPEPEGLTANFFQVFFR